MSERTLFQSILSTKQHIKLNASFNSIAMTTVVILSDKSQNSLTGNDYTMAAFMTTHL
jgi:hypothetical protein